MRKPKENEIIQGHKLKLHNLTNEQKRIMDRNFDYVRYVYNWGKALEDEQYEKYLAGEVKYSFIEYEELTNLFTEFRHKKGNEWLLRYTLSPAYKTLKDLVSNYKKFFKKIRNKPKFKSKKKGCKYSYGVRNDTAYIVGNEIKIEGIKDKLDLGFDTGYDKSKKIYQIVISRDHFGDYYASFTTIEEKQIDDRPYSDPLGIDLGHRNTLTFSRPINGSYFYQQPKEQLKKLDKGKRLVQQKLSHLKNAEKKKQNVRKPSTIKKLLRARLNCIMRINIESFAEKSITLKLMLMIP